MKNRSMPKNYIGREQAYVKHTILRTYIERMFMIVGRTKEDVINYVDCFAGPWKEEDDNLRDTSIGVSLEKMNICQKGLEEQFGRKVKFRALYIEKDPDAFKRLQAFLAENPYQNIETHCLNGDYAELIDDITDWCGNHFSFFFVDPTGWQKVIGASTMQELLSLGKAEFLINFMYDFINRAVGLENHVEDMLEIFGEIPSLGDESPEQRQNYLLKLYRNNVNKIYKGRAACVPVMRPGKERVLYYLVYFTRHPVGIDVFKTQAQEMEIVQRITQQECRLRSQISQSNTIDMFGSELVVSPDEQGYSDNRLMAKEYLLSNLSNEPILIDYDKWAEFLEESNLYPVDFQEGMKELVQEGKVENIDADVSRRRTKIIKPGRRNKSERWVLK